jgi:hypothetical protein
MSANQPQKKGDWKKVQSKKKQNPNNNDELIEALKPAITALFGNYKKKDQVAPIWMAMAQKIEELIKDQARQRNGDLRNMAWIEVTQFLLDHKVDIEEKTIYKGVETTAGDLILTEDFKQLFKELLTAGRRRSNWAPLFCTKIGGHTVKLYAEGDKYGSKDPDVVLHVGFEPVWFEHDDEDDTEIPLDNSDEYPDLPKKNQSEEKVIAKIEPKAKSTPITGKSTPITTTKDNEEHQIVKDLTKLQGLLSKVMYAVTQTKMTSAEKKEVHTATNATISILEVISKMTKTVEETPTQQKADRFSSIMTSNPFGQAPIGDWGSISPDN